MSTPLQLVFFGELIEGFGIDEVRRNLAQSFKLGDEQLDRMFGGHAVVLKRNLGSDEAARYVAHLAGLGARAQMRPMPGAANTPNFKVEPSVLSPLPTLIVSDGPLDSQPFPRDTSPVEPFVPLRAALLPTPSASPPPPIPAEPMSLAPAQPHRAEVACPKCGERQPMVLLCRNCATNLEMALAVRAEEEAATRAERIDATRARHGLPPSGYGKSGFGTSGHAHSRQRTGAGDPPYLWGMGWDGRIGRLNFATGMFALWAVLVVVDIVTHRMPAALAGTLFALGNIAVYAMSLRQTALRFHDRGHSGWWNLLWALPYLVFMLAMASPRVGMRLLVPAGLVMIGVLLYVLFFRGDEDNNAWGNTPRDGSGGAFLASIVAFITFSVLAPDDSALARRMRNVGQDDTTVAQRLRSVEAKRAYMTEYLLARDSRAFAASPDGSWGWVAEARSDDAAMNEAIGICDKHRPVTQRACELVSVNGRPVGTN